MIERGSGCELTSASRKRTGLAGLGCFHTYVLPSKWICSKHSRSGGHREAFWDDLWIPVLASAIGDDMLDGMNRLDGHRLLIEAVSGGAVEIDPIC
jgi:hypothetical protein